MHDAIMEIDIMLRIIMLSVSILALSQKILL